MTRSQGYKVTPTTRDEETFFLPFYGRGSCPARESGVDLEPFT